MALVPTLFSTYFSSDITTRLWIVGDSIVRHAGDGNHQLRGAGVTVWKGLSGARWAGVTNRLSRYLRTLDSPHVLILHLGTNDIFRTNLGNIRARILANINAIRQLLPDTQIIWSDILQRLAYRGEAARGAGNRSTRNLNSYARRVLGQMDNTHIIKYSDIISSGQPAMYHTDNIHLNDQGKAAFRQRISDALVFFNANQGQFIFP